ncbi:hypothetical protein L1987_60304 [Smallanthus sonchifolius]|uniref:Uncharacterized protein n=1 Tax=Smallanthus sonchifolius TaxID=185202 RepID=A0ACB9D7W1_9ASTR|nr:hypothetical protein L1987_60304 [Smallanthus sonchifolius]
MRVVKRKNNKPPVAKYETLHRRARFCERRRKDGIKSKERAQVLPSYTRMDTEANVENGSLVLIKQGAEARVFESTFSGRKSTVKERFSKKYRHPTLDSKLTLKRLNADARCMTKARRLGVSTPVLYAVDTVSHTLTFEYVEGPSIKDIFLKFGLQGVVEEKMDGIALQIGDTIGKLHDGGVIHGDLTTSNMLWRSGINHWY